LRREVVAAVAILDATHVTDKFYDKVGKALGDKPSVTPVNGGKDTLKY
jgi:hypothetical protein